MSIEVVYINDQSPLRELAKANTKTYRNEATADSHFVVVVVALDGTTREVRGHHSRCKDS